MYYPSAVQFLETDDPLRTQWAQEFKGIPSLASRATLDPPDVMTMSEAHEAAERIERKESTQRAERWAFRSVWCEYLPNFDIVNQTVAGPEHLISDTVKNLLELLTTAPNSQMTFSDARKTHEQARGRFTSDSDVTWRCSARVRNLLTELLHHLKPCHGWAKIKNIIKKPGSLKVRACVYSLNCTKVQNICTIVQICTN